jgi:hypothetical protein
VKKFLFTIGALISFAAASQANLSPKAFAELKAYAKSEGDFYLGESSIRNDNGQMDYYWRFGSKEGMEHAYVFCRFVTTARDAVAAYRTSYYTHFLMMKDCQEKERQYQETETEYLNWITRLQNEKAELQAAKTGKVD